MPSEHAKHSPSQLKYKAACPNWENDNSSNNYAANVGTRLHAIMELYAKFIAGGSEEFNLEDYSEEDQALLGWCMKIIEPYLRQTQNSDVHVEKKLSIPYTTWGTCDLVLVQGKRVIMFDYKFGQGAVDAPSENHQARAYALGAAFGFEPESIEFHFLLPKRNEHLKHNWLVGEVFGWLEEFKEIVRKADSDGEPNQPSSSTCVYCGAKATCPDVVNTAMQVANRFEGLPIPAEPNLNALTSPSDISLALELAAVMERFSKSVKHKALEMVLDGQEIPGYELKIRKANRRVKDVLEAWDALQDKIELSDFLPACKVSITELERAVKDKVPRGEKAKYAASVLGDLTSVGIISRGEDIPYIGKA
jgi:hypothetical protein